MATLPAGRAGRKRWAEIEKIVAQPDVRAQMAKLGAEPRYLPPKGIVDFVAAEQPQWAKLLKDVKPAN